jgi:hypothetical protein
MPAKKKKETLSEQVEKLRDEVASCVAKMEDFEAEHRKMRARLDQTWARQDGLATRVSAVEPNKPRGAEMREFLAAAADFREFERGFGQWVKNPKKMRDKMTKEVKAIMDGVTGEIHQAKEDMLEQLGQVQDLVTLARRTVAAAKPKALPAPKKKATRKKKATKKKKGKR